MQRRRLLIRPTLALFQVQTALALSLLVLAACSGADATNPLLTCSCPAVADPVCGVDGVSYESGCNAECANVKIAHAGGCQNDGGACTCAPTSDPVCGANGVTYENACSAACANETIAQAGACNVPFDAGVSTSDGAATPGDCTSQSCGSSQVCVSDPCPVPTCTLADDAGACPAGFTYSPGSCYPGNDGPPPGACNRSCPSGDFHHCVDVPASCSQCSCLPPDVNVCPAGGACGYIMNGIVECVSG